MSVCLCVCVSVYLCVCVSVCLCVCVSGCLGVWASGSLGDWAPGCLGVLGVSVSVTATVSPSRTYSNKTARQRRLKEFAKVQAWRQKKILRFNKPYDDHNYGGNTGLTIMSTKFKSKHRDKDEFKSKHRDKDEMTGRRAAGRDGHTDTRYETIASVLKAYAY